jgi:hypothetical protein
MAEHVMPQNAGANLHSGGDASIGGDVVGRDKITESGSTSYITINISNLQLEQLIKQSYKEVAVRINNISEGDLGNGIRIGGRFKDVPLEVLAADWVDYLENGRVISGWLYISGTTISHAVTFFKIYLDKNGTGYIHILDAANPPHMVWLSTNTGDRHEKEFCWDGVFGVERTDLWKFTWK